MYKLASAQSTETISDTHSYTQDTVDVLHKIK